MTRAVVYKTRQQKAILDYIVSLDDAHVTAAQVVEHFEKEKVVIGRTTIYRHLEKLTESGKLRKYITDGISGACYQHVEDAGDCSSHLHLKCEGCGKLQHLDCDMLEEIERHVFDEHAFRINGSKTVLYGNCDECAATAEVRVQ